MFSRSKGRHLSPAALAFLGMTLFMALAVTGATAAETSDTTTRTFSGATAKEIRFSTSNGAIEVLAHSGNNIEVTILRRAKSFSEGQAEKLLDRIQIQTSQAGGRVEVKVVLPSFVFGGSTAADIQARIPATWQGKLSLNTSNGSIDVAGLRGTGEFGTSNGQVTIDEWQGSLQVTTSNGRIDAGKLNLTGTSSFKTSNGGITMDLTKLSGSLGVRTSNGAVYLTLPDSVKASLQADTSNGTISFTGVGQQTQSAKKSFSTQINGGGASIDLNTSNGAITIEMAPAQKGSSFKM